MSKWAYGADASSCPAACSQKAAQRRASRKLPSGVLPEGCPADSSRRPSGELSRVAAQRLALSGCSPAASSATLTIDRGRTRGGALAAADHARRWRPKRWRRAGHDPSPQRQPDRCNAWRCTAGGPTGAGAQRPSPAGCARDGASASGARPRKPRHIRSRSGGERGVRGVRRPSEAVSAQERHGAAAGGAGQRNRQARPAPVRLEEGQRTRVP